MAHVLVGFAGPIVVTPSFFGVKDENELVAYLHSWRVLGNLLGIDDNYNPFAGDLRTIQIQFYADTVDPHTVDIFANPTKFVVYRP
jgi:hypothetical protein